MLLLSKRHQVRKRNTSIIFANPSIATQGFGKQLIKLKRTSVSTLRLIQSEIKGKMKMKELISSNLDSFYSFAKIIGVSQINPFDLSPTAKKDFTGYIMKFDEVLQATGLSYAKAQKKLEAFVNGQKVSDQTVNHYICQQFLIKQQRVIQTIFESEKYITETKLDDELMEHILAWNNMDILYSLIFWKYSDLFEQNDKKILHESVILGFKKFKQFLFFANQFFVYQSSASRNIISAFEALQSYAIKAYDVLVRKVEQLHDFSKKELELFEFIRNMSKDFVSGDFSSSKPITEKNKLQNMFFKKLNNVNEAFKNFEKNMKREISLLTVSDMDNESQGSLPFDFGDDSSKSGDDFLDIVNKVEEDYYSSDEESISDKGSTVLSEAGQAMDNSMDFFEEFKQSIFYQKNVLSNELNQDLLIELYVQTFLF